MRTSARCSVPAGEHPGESGGQGEAGRFFSGRLMDPDVAPDTVPRACPRRFA
jgi:hypothetical protein